MEAGVNQRSAAQDVHVAAPPTQSLEESSAPTQRDASDDTTLGEAGGGKAARGDSDDDEGRRNDLESSMHSTGSMATPPYWQNLNTHHRRTASSQSSGSILPAGAITLLDNETEDQEDRNSACWAKSVEIVDYTIVNGSATNIGAFVVWNVKVETLNGSSMNIRKRYSEFDDFRSRLVQSFPNFEAAVPNLPPKSVISKFRPKFLNKRRAGLQYFLNCILLNPEFSGSPVLKEFLFS